MTTYKLLKQLGNKNGGVHSDLRKKPESPDPESVQAVSVSKQKCSFQITRLLFLAVAVGFMGCFWMIFQLVNASQVHEVRFQRLINALDKQEAALKSIGDKMTEVSSALPKVNEDITALAKKTDATYVEAAKLNEVVAGQLQAIENLKKQTLAIAAQTQINSQVK